MVGFRVQICPEAKGEFWELSAMSCELRAKAWMEVPRVILDEL